MGMGFMAVFAVSGSVVLVASQVHKRLLSDFMKKIESEICGYVLFKIFLIYFLLFLFFSFF